MPQRAESQVTETPSIIPVTAAVGSAGQALLAIGATAYVQLANSHRGGPVQYKVGDTAWLELDLGQGVELLVNLQSTSVRLRKLSPIANAAEVRVVQGVLNGVGIGAALIGATTGVAPAIASAPTLAGGGVVGQAITLTPGGVSGTPAPTSTFSWRDAGGNELSTSASAFTPVASGQITVVQTASNGVGSPATRMSNTVTVAAAPTLVLKNNLIRTNGDSRAAQMTEGTPANVNEAVRQTIKSYMPWFLARVQHRARWVSNNGINGERVAGIIARQTGNGNGTAGQSVAPGTSPTWRATTLTNVPGGAAGISLNLYGVNDTGSAITTVGPQLDTAFMAEIDNAGAAVLFDELPDAGIGGAGRNIERSAYIRGWPDSSTGMTQTQKDYYRARRLVFQSYGTLTGGDLSLNYPLAGLAPSTDQLHYGGAGGRLIGEALGDLMLPILTANGFPRRDQLPAVAADSLLPNWDMAGTAGTIQAETAGAGGANMDGAGGVGVSGSVPTGWTFNRSANLRALLNDTQGQGSQLSIVLTKETDADGFPLWVAEFTSANGIGAANTFYSCTLYKIDSMQLSGLTNMNGVSGNNLVDGDTVTGISYVAHSANPKGLVAFQSTFGCTSNAFPATERSVRSVGPGIPGTGQLLKPGDQLDVCAAYGPVVDLTESYPLPAGFTTTAETKTFRRLFDITLIGGVPINFKVKLGRFTAVRNR